MCVRVDTGFVRAVASCIDVSGGTGVCRVVVRFVFSVCAVYECVRVCLCCGDVCHSLLRRS
eukprot:EC716730.1.p2 GENE.EC716730.1~~EC716730.1.p2  ORF type:complete len:61 (+),score=7.73 EC716730.1:215-397(+)